MSVTDLYERAERFYQERLRTDLERTHLNSFVAIEPESGDFFLGRTLSEASAAASAAHPDRRCCVLRVGHAVALHLGCRVMIGSVDGSGRALVRIRLKNPALSNGSMNGGGSKSFPTRDSIRCSAWASFWIAICTLTIEPKL